MEINRDTVERTLMMRDISKLKTALSGSGDALVANTLDQFANVTQTAGKTLSITDNTTLNGGTHSGTNTGDQTSVSGNAGTVTDIGNLTGVVTSTNRATAIANGAITNAMLANGAVANLTGTNSGDQTSIVGITGTKAQFDTAVTDGNFAYSGDTPTSHTHGNLTNAGAIGVTSGLPVKTGTSGVLEAGAFGTGAGTFAEGNHLHTGVYAPVLGADDNYVTDAEKAVIGNTSGTNTGDQTSVSGNAGTVTSIGDLTGVVTSTNRATAIANGAITNAMLANSAVTNLSGTNTGDNATNTLYSGLVSNATHTGDATGSTALSVVKIQGKDFPALAVGDDQKYPKYNHSTNAFVMSTITGGAGGDVYGPVSSTDNALARFDLTTGKLLQNSGVTLNDNGEMVFPAGGVADTPIKLTAGTNLTTAEAGAFEYDGRCFYLTPIASARGVNTSTMFAIVPTGGFALTALSSVQSAFPAATDVWTLAASTSYFFEGAYYINKTTTAVTTAMAFEAGGGASVTSMNYDVISHAAAMNTTVTANNSTYVNQLVSTVVTISTAINVLIRFRGIIRMNAGGTITPQIKFSGIPVLPSMNVNSWIRFTPIGTNTVASVGNVA